jgi:nicotinamidase-related amidase
MKRFFRILSVFLLIPFTFMSQDSQPQKRALIIVDVQEFYFNEGNSQLVNPKEASKQAAKLLSAFRESDELVVHIRHESSKDSAIHENVKPNTGEKVITKKFVNSYRETDLLKYLQENDITQVIICGMMTHMCVEGAARASADYGFDVVVIDDACATRDLKLGAKTVKAADVHVSALATIEGYYGTVMTTDEFLGK